MKSICFMEHKWYAEDHLLHCTKVLWTLRCAAVNVNQHINWSSFREIKLHKHITQFTKDPGYLKTNKSIIHLISFSKIFESKSCTLCSYMSVLNFFWDTSVCSSNHWAFDIIYPTKNIFLNKWVNNQKVQA